MAEHAELIVVGGGPAGRTVARMVRRQRPDWRVVVIKEDEVNPNRCVIPYIYDDTVPVAKGTIPNTMVTEVGAELVIARAEVLDAAARQLTAGGTTYSYDHLVLATGSEPIVPPIPGVELDGVVPVRTMPDIEQLMAVRERAQHAVVIGLGLIGAEVAAALQRAGLKVTGVDLLPHSLGAVLDDDYAAEVDRQLTAHGVALKLGAKVSAVLGDAQGRARAVVVDGAEVPAELVVLAVGVRPRVELAQAAGAQVERGIITDEQQQTTLSGVYAVGDCVESRCHLTGQPVMSQLGTTAVIQAKVAAKTILGQPARFSGSLVSWACQIYDLPVGGLGLRPEQARAAGRDIIVGESETLSQYPQMPHVQPVHARLVFERGSLKVLGGQIRGTFAVAGYLDLLALAIDSGLTARELAGIQYATHPELAPRPSDNLMVMAAVNALRQAK